jgi:hypothetical protein
VKLVVESNGGIRAGTTVGTKWKLQFHDTVVSIPLKRAFTAVGFVCTRLDATIIDRQIVRMIANDLRSR